TDPVGVVIGAASPLPLGGVMRNRLYVGIALYIVPDEVVRVIAHTPEQPFFPLYDNRTQRLVVLPTLAPRIGRGVSLWLSRNCFAGLSGRVFAVEGATRSIEARVDEQILSRVAVNAGVRWQANRKMAFALVYRQQYGVPFRTVTVNRVAGQPIDLDVD